MIVDLSLLSKAIDEGDHEKIIRLNNEGLSTGTNPAEEVFITTPALKERFGSNFERIPTGARGLYTYMGRLAQGLRQIMAGPRKFALEYVTRDDITALTEEAANISGICYVTEVDKEEANKILDG